MRLWLDPNRLAARGLTADDVVNALQEQNVEVAAGQVGQMPARAGQSFQISVRAVGRLTDPAQFDGIILKRGADGALVRLKDVGRAELGAENYASNLRYDGQESVGFGVLQRPDANTLDVYRGVIDELNTLSRQFPPGIKYQVAFETTSVISQSIHEVLTTLGIAIVLVIIVMFVFLQDWRATLIPAITIPVSLVGAFAFVKAFGFSINTLTLFGIVLATGLVVDDAIVVIENIQRHIHDYGTPAKRAASDAMREVTGAVVATAMVLAAVFVPVAFFPGTTGRLYQQFALTIAFSMALSAFNALTLTPALSALLLRGERRKGPFFRLFNRLVAGGTDLLLATLRRLIRVRWLVTAVFILALALTWWVYRKVPSGFVPQEDQGMVMILIQAPEGASVDYTTGIIKQVEGDPGPGAGNSGRLRGDRVQLRRLGSNRGMMFISLKPYDERPGDAHSAQAIVGRLFGALSRISGAIVFPILPPAINGLGTFGGFQYELLDESGGPIQRLADTARQVAGQASATPGLTGLFTAFTANDPQFVVTIDRERAKSLGLSLSSITDALQVFMGSVYVNDFDFNNRSYPRATCRPTSSSDRTRATSALRGAGAGRVDDSAASLITIRESTAPQAINHYNLFRSAEITGSAAPGYSSGQAIQLMQQLSDRVLPQGMSYAWSGLSLEEIKAGSQSVAIFGLGLLLVYLTLAGQYESLTLPFIILLAVPLGVLGALSSIWARGLINDVYVQIGLVVLIGLSAKNGILLVEFAEQLREKGMTIAEAAVEAARIRVRPIVMTSLAFILGVIPLVIATGAGHEARRSVGTAVAGGMIAATFLNLAFIPVLYVVVKRLVTRGADRPRGADDTETTHA